VVVAEVDHAVAGRGGGPQAFEVVQIAALDVGAERGDLGRGGVRAGQAEHLVAGGEQFGDDGGRDPAGRPGDEDTHEKPPDVTW
jgi:hypothetical protein